MNCVCLRLWLNGRHDCLYCMVSFEHCGIGGNRGCITQRAQYCSCARHHSCHASHSRVSHFGPRDFRVFFRCGYRDQSIGQSVLICYPPFLLASFLCKTASSFFSQCRLLCCSVCWCISIPILICSRIYSIHRFIIIQARSFIHPSILYRKGNRQHTHHDICLLYTSPSPRDS